MIIHGDCVEGMKTLPDNSIDSIVTDPPYELGFMGKSWDSTGIAYSIPMWKECLRVLKPGGHLLAFSGTRTYHRMAVAIEDAGFEVRDMIEWVTGSGFPKSLNLNKALLKKCTCGNMEVYDKQRTKQNTKHNMRPVSETDLSQKINTTKEQGEVLQSELSEQSVSLSRNSTENVWEGQSSLERGSNVKTNSRELSGNDLSEMPEGVSANGEERRLHNATQVSDGSTLKQITDENGSSASHRPQSEKQQDREPCAFCKQHGTQEIRRLYEATYGLGSALKPAHEPICVARKPISEKTLIDNFIKYGTGGINIDESRVEVSDNDKIEILSKANKQDTTNNIIKGFGNNTAQYGDWSMSKGRFPANLIHDNSEEVRECFPDSKAGKNKEEKGTGGIWNKGTNLPIGPEYGDSGSASRFFKSIIYQAKSSKAERTNGGTITNQHPTIKPIALMEYLIKMITPPKGVVLDPFTGSGSTGVACLNTGNEFIGCELNDEYIPIILARLGNPEVIKIEDIRELPKQTPKEPQKEVKKGLSSCCHADIVKGYCVSCCDNVV